MGRKDGEGGRHGEEGWGGRMGREDGEGGRGGRMGREDREGGWREDVMGMEGGWGAEREHAVDDVSGVPSAGALTGSSSV